MKTKNKFLYLSKLTLITFCLLITCYSQYGYAGMEKYLTQDRQDRNYILIKDKPDKVMLEELVEFLTDKNIYSLTIGAYTVTPDMAQKIIAALLANKTLIKFELLNNQIGIEGARAIAEVLRENRILIKLNLAWSDIGDEGAEVIAESLLRNRTLAQLDLSGNGISATGVQAIAGALRLNTSLTKLNLHGNKIGNVAVQTIAEALRENRTLTHLDLGNAGINDEGAKALAFALRENDRLLHLDLEHNYIGAEGAVAIMEALRENKALIQLNLSGYTDSIKLLLEALQYNIILQDLILPTQNPLVLQILERNKLIARLRKNVRKLNLKTVLLGTHRRAGKDSPLNVLDIDILREITSRVWLSAMDEMAFNDILYATEDELTVLTQEEYNLVNQIRSLQNTIMAGLEQEVVHQESWLWQPLRMLVFRRALPLPVAAAVVEPLQINTTAKDERRLTNITAEKPVATVSIGAIPEVVAAAAPLQINTTQREEPFVNTTADEQVATAAKEPPYKRPRRENIAHTTGADMPRDTK